MGGCERSQERSTPEVEQEDERRAEHDGCADEEVHRWDRQVADDSDPAGDGGHVVTGRVAVNGTGRAYFTELATWLIWGLVPRSAITLPLARCSLRAGYWCDLPSCMPVIDPPSPGKLPRQCFAWRG
jgi:hypothetical protein